MPINGIDPMHKSRLLKLFYSSICPRSIDKSYSKDNRNGSTNHPNHINNDSKNHPNRPALPNSYKSIKHSNYFQSATLSPAICTILLFSSFRWGAYIAYSSIVKCAITKPMIWFLIVVCCFRNVMTSLLYSSAVLTWWAIWLKWGASFTRVTNRSFCIFRIGRNVAFWNFSIVDVLSLSGNESVGRRDKSVDSLRIIRLITSQRELCWIDKKKIAKNMSVRNFGTRGMRNLKQFTSSNNHTFTQNKPHDQITQT